MVDVAQLKSLILLQMEDECSIGNDETRIFILSSYASNKMNRVPCVLCKNIMYIFDRYPLIDGTFFLSPRQHSNSCIKVGSDQKAFVKPRASVIIRGLHSCRSNARERPATWQLFAWPVWRVGLATESSAGTASSRGQEGTSSLEQCIPMTSLLLCLAVKNDSR